MAQASSKYLTTDAYIEHRWAQDDLIRKEFEKHHNHLETRHRELREDLDNVKANVTELKVDLGELKVDFGELKVDFGELKVDFGELKVDFGELKVDFGELKVDFQRMQGQMHNRAVRSLFMRIEPIGIYKPGTGLVMPTLFPKNAKEFWNLRTPRTTYQLELLTYMVQFYDVQDYKTWKSTDARTNSQKSESEDEHYDKSESDADTENSQYSLEEAVQTYPDMAVDALAPKLGLVEADFDSFRARFAEYRQRPPKTVSKRQPEPISRGSAKRGGKRLKEKPQSPIPTAASALEQRPSIPLHQLIESPKSRHSDAASEQPHVEWDNTSALEAIQKIIDGAKRGKSRTTQSPEAQMDNETISAVQSVLDRPPRRRLRGLRETSSEVFPGSPTQVTEKSAGLEKSPGVEAIG